MSCEIEKKNKYVHKGENKTEKVHCPEFVTLYLYLDQSFCIYCNDLYKLLTRLFEG